eukprot:GHVP01029935.1.p1 GENE.GHVP01029935.1~~GHVP01029935.1.p1  ORF type:complete len:398 (+),score=54.30 GHVP01029935.1:29-1222(+)
MLSWVARLLITTYVSNVTQNVFNSLASKHENLVTIFASFISAILIEHLLGRFNKNCLPLVNYVALTSFQCLSFEIFKTLPRKFDASTCFLAAVIGWHLIIFCCQFFSGYKRAVISVVAAVLPWITFLDKQRRPILWALLTDVFSFWKLELYWLVLLFSFVPSIWKICTTFFRDEISKSSRILVRKSYHLILSLVLFPAIHFQGCEAFAAKAVICVLILMLLLEIWRISVPQEDFVKKFLEAHWIKVLKEEEVLTNVVTSHMTLLFGSAFPLLMTEFFGSDSLSRNELRLLNVQGILAVGIGDSFAALAGSNFKSRKLPFRNEKTTIGTFAFFASNFALSSVYCWWLDLASAEKILALAMHSSILAFVEAGLLNEDNAFVGVASFASFFVFWKKLWTI